MPNNAVLYRKEDRVGIITLNRPERLNAINEDLLTGLIQRLREAGSDPDVASVILTGAGKSFCAGEDLKETSQSKSFEQWVREVDGLQDVQRVIARIGQTLDCGCAGVCRRRGPGVCPEL